MKAKYVILLLMLAGIALAAFSDDYIDDVYYWETEEPVSSSRSRDATETQAIDNTPQKDIRITFIEDSVTQRSDTVVKAVIHR